jgi:hypothetical protein
MMVKDGVELEHALKMETRNGKLHMKIIIHSYQRMSLRTG